MNSKRSFSALSSLGRQWLGQVFGTHTRHEPAKRIGVRLQLEALESRTLMSVMADFNGDGYGDLAIGVPYEDVPIEAGDAFSAGAVNVLYGSANGLTGAGNQIW